MGSAGLTSLFAVTGCDQSQPQSPAADVASAEPKEAPPSAMMADEASTPARISLRSGASLEGMILKRTGNELWLDVGPTVVVLNTDEIAEVTSDDVAEAPVDMKELDLFAVADGLGEKTPKEHAKSIGPAVIKVSTPGGLGSGVIINPEGYAVTNAHVVQGETALRATVWFPQQDGTLKRTVIEDIEIIALNNHLDLALIQIDHPEGGDFDIATIEVEDSVEGGQEVFAIGNPLGLERTLTQGVVSTRNRAFDGLSYIQTDTPINPGNSGGPLFNSRGEVIGITNMIIGGGQSLGFAIPARYVKDFLRNREAFAYDSYNSNSGRSYHQPPRRLNYDDPAQLHDGMSPEN